MNVLKYRLMTKCGAMSESKIINHNDNICLIGLGYVGIPLIKIIAKSLKPKNLIGLDIDLRKIEDGLKD